MNPKSPPNPISKLHQQLRIILVVSVIALLAVGYFMNNFVTQAADDNLTTESQIIANQKNIEDYQTIVKSYSFTIDQAELLTNQALPDTIDEASIITMFNTLSAKAQVKIGRIDFDPTPPVASAVNSGLVPTNLSLVIDQNTSYNNLIGFIKLIENSRRRTRIASLSISPNAENRTQISQATIKLIVYSEK